MNENQRIKATTQLIVEMLVEANYDGIENLTNGCRLNAKEISEVISNYGGSLIMPPEVALDNLDVIEIEEQKLSQWSVNINLWTVEEGQSDLTLELTLIDNGKEILETDIDNIHVH